MRKSLQSISNLAAALATIILLASPASAQIQLSGPPYVPSNGTSTTGSATINFTADANCNVLNATNCTVSGGASGPYLGGYLVTGTISTQRNVVTITPTQQNRSFNVTNKTSGGFGIQVIASTGTGCVVANGTTVPVVWDGTNYACAGGGSVSGVASFNARAGAVTLGSSDVTSALSYSPLNPANNLGDLGSAPSARTNLGLQSMATQDAGSVAITGGAATLKDLGTVFYVDGFPTSCTIGGTAYTTQADCAFFTAKAKVLSITNNVSLVFGEVTYNKCAEWTQPSGFPKVNLIGTSMQSTVINQACNTPTIPMMSDADGFPIYMIENLTFYAGQKASSCFDLLGGAQGGSIRNVTCDIPATTAVSGSDHALQIGSATFPAQSMHIDNLYVGSAPFSVTPTMASLTPAGTTSLTGITINSGGADYDSTYAVGLVNDPHMYCLGDEPTFTVTLTGGVVTGTTITHAGTCTQNGGGLPDLGVINQYPITYGMKLFATDSVISNATSSVGIVGIDMEGSQSTLIHAHPISTQIGIRATNSNTYNATEFDTVYSIGADIIGNSGMNFLSTTAYTSFGIPPGAVIYQAESGASNVAFQGSGGLCSLPVPLDYSMLSAVPYGTPTPFQYPQWPANFQVFGYDGTCAFTGPQASNQTQNTFADLYSIFPLEATYIDYYANISNLIPYNGHPGSITMVLDGVDSNDCTVGGGTVVHFCFAGSSAWVPYTFPLSAQLPVAPAHQLPIGPTSGAAASPTMRALDPSDIPMLNQDTTGKSGTTDSIAGNISAGAGLSSSGSCTLASPCTISQSSTGVAAGSYANMSASVGTDGRVTAAQPTYDFVATGDRQPIISNPDFNTGTAIPPPGWVTNNPGISVSYETSSPAPNKSQSVKFTSTVQYAGLEYLRSFSAIPGDTYIVSGYVKAAGGSAPQITFQFQDNNGGYLGECSASNAGTSWLMATNICTSPSGTARAALTLQNNASGGAGTSYFDDVNVRLISDLMTIDSVQTITGAKTFTNTVTATDFTDVNVKSAPCVGTNSAGTLISNACVVVSTGITCSSSGVNSSCYQLYSDGTIHQWGQQTCVYQGFGGYCAYTVTFPIPYTTAASQSFHSTFLGCIPGDASCITNAAVEGSGGQLSACSHGNVSPSNTYLSTTGRTAYWEAAEGNSGIGVCFVDDQLISWDAWGK